LAREKIVRLGSWKNRLEKTQTGTSRWEEIMANQEAVAVIEGPKGKAEIYEIFNLGRLEYEVRFQGEVLKYKNLGEAYVEAGQKTGTKT
jgi:hypothetical protein